MQVDPDFPPRRTEEDLAVRRPGNPGTPCQNWLHLGMFSAIQKSVCQTSNHPLEVLLDAKSDNIFVN